jgi:hypothetical protein
MSKAGYDKPMYMIYSVWCRSTSVNGLFLLICRNLVGFVFLYYTLYETLPLNKPIHVLGFWFWFTLRYTK